MQCLVGYWLAPYQHGWRPTPHVNNRSLGHAPLHTHTPRVQDMQGALALLAQRTTVLFTDGPPPRTVLVDPTTHAITLLLDVGTVPDAVLCATPFPGLPEPSCMQPSECSYEHVCVCAGGAGACRARDRRARVRAKPFPDLPRPLSTQPVRCSIKRMCVRAHVQVHGCAEVRAPHVTLSRANRASATNRIALLPFPFLF